MGIDGWKGIRANDEVQVRAVRSGSGDARGNSDPKADSKDALFNPVTRLGMSRDCRL